MTTEHAPETLAPVTLPDEEPATETTAAEAQAEAKKRKTRSDAGYPRKGGFYCLVTTAAPNPEDRGTKLLLDDGAEGGLPAYFATIEEFKAFVAANVRVNESYQPVQTVGKPWGLVVGETAPLL